MGHTVFPRAASPSVLRICLHSHIPYSFCRHTLARANMSDQHRYSTLSNRSFCLRRPPRTGGQTLPYPTFPDCEVLQHHNRSSTPARTSTVLLIILLLPVLLQHITPFPFPPPSSFVRLHCSLTGSRHPCLATSATVFPCSRSALGRSFVLLPYTSLRQELRFRAISSTSTESPSEAMGGFYMQYLESKLLSPRSHIKTGRP